MIGDWCLTLVGYTVSGSFDQSINGIYDIAHEHDDGNPYYAMKGSDTRVLYWAKTDQRWIIAEKIGGSEFAAEPYRSSVGFKPPRNSGWITGRKESQDTKKEEAATGATPSIEDMVETKSRNTAPGTDAEEGDKKTGKLTSIKGAKSFSRYHSDCHTRSLLHMMCPL